MNGETEIFEKKMNDKLKNINYNDIKFICPLSKSIDQVIEMQKKVLYYLSYFLNFK